MDTVAVKTAATTAWARKANGMPFTLPFSPDTIR
jgi:hypothetical protein